jgi:hypothetical protein
MFRRAWRIGPRGRHRLVALPPTAGLVANVVVCGATNAGAAACAEGNQGRHADGGAARAAQPTFGRVPYRNAAEHGLGRPDTANALPRSAETRRAEKMRSGRLIPTREPNDDLAFQANAVAQYGCPFAKVRLSI